MENIRQSLKYFPNLDNIDALLSNITDKIQKMTLGGNAKKERLSFMRKMIHINLMIECAKMIQAHSLYPQLSVKAPEQVPLMTIAHGHIMGGVNLPRKRQRNLILSSAG